MGFFGAGMTVDDLFEDLKKNFRRRKFSAGLLITFVDFLLELDAPALQLRDLDDFFQHFPRRTTTRSGGAANQLIVERDGGTVGIRKFYDAVEALIRSKHHRFDYPKGPAHATQAWPQHQDWLETLVTLDEAELLALRRRVLNFVLEALPDQAFDPSRARREPPLFHYLLDGFDLSSRRGEPTGAAYQGIVFGFLRADNPHLQVEIKKVRAGGARTKNFGDIDCWDGGRLAISAEVKQYVVSGDTTEFVPFANRINQRGALGMVVAIDFAADVRTQIEDLGVRALSQDDLLHIVDLWDPIKQRAAVSSLFYYVEHVEQNSALIKRLREYLAEQQGESSGDD